MTTLISHRCAECGDEGSAVILKACKSCMQVKYCDATCQKNHWPTHKTPCKLRAAELRDVALFKDPPPKEECPICFVPMPTKMIDCMSLPPATITSVPIYDFALANEEFAEESTKAHYTCCGKDICRVCIDSISERCPFCNSNTSKTSAEKNAEIMVRVDANDPSAICMLANAYRLGINGFQQDRSQAIELYIRAAELGSSDAYCLLGYIYSEEGEKKKAKYNYEAAAMAGHEVARNNLGVIEAMSGNMERAAKHWTIAASDGNYRAMHELRDLSENGLVGEESIDSTLAAYNSSCDEMRSEERDAYIFAKMEG